MHKKGLLIILDGWGYRTERKGNAIRLAKTPVIDSLWKKYPHTLLDASGMAVGLPPGIMGNSQVGHLTIGAGRIIKTDLLRVNNAIHDGSFFRNEALLEAFSHCRKKQAKLHLMGLLSDGSVHSHISHLFALLEMAKKQGVLEVYVHAFLDGRDTPPALAGKYLKMLLDYLKNLGIGTLATMMGRYYAMDRDNRWKREHKAYECMVNCAGNKKSDPFAALQEYYDKGITDEFVPPTILTNKCVVEEHDSIIFFNFRSDRARELTRAFVLGRFQEFQRKRIIDLKFVTLTQYDALLKHIPVAFPPIVPERTLGEILSVTGMKQLRLGETEKWAHVTYFFNGLCECIFPNEHRILIPSRKVTTYDKTPEMKAFQIARAFIKNRNDYDFFVVNFANGDMVGHTGKLNAAIQGVEAVDKALGLMLDRFDGAVFITADHGNCEDMLGESVTCHTTHKVPFIMNAEGTLRAGGGLADVAPTMLDVLGIKKPKEMNGKSLWL